MLLREGVISFRLDGLLTLIAMTYCGKFKTLRQCSEQMRENVKKFDLQRATAFWTNMRDPGDTLTQYLLQQSDFEAGEDEIIKKDEDVQCNVVGRPPLIDLCLALRIREDYRESVNL